MNASAMPRNAKFSYFGFYLDKFYARIIGVLYAHFSNILSFMDRKLVDRAVELQKIIWITFAKTLRLIDVHLIDGSVKALASFGQLVGWMFTGVQSGKVQVSLQWLLLPIVLILISMLIL
jgi:hypothetical protein